MSTEDTALMRYRPDIVQIENIGIGLYETNETMSLVPKQQYMVVGERFNQGSPLPSHNLIVDNTGVAINTSLVARSNLSTDYALYVSGDVFVDGTIHGSVVSSGECNRHTFRARMRHGILTTIFIMPTMSMLRIGTLQRVILTSLILQHRPIETSPKLI